MLLLVLVSGTTEILQDLENEDFKGLQLLQRQELPLSRRDSVSL